MELTHFPSAEAMLAEAGDYLAAREAEHNLPLGILGTLRDHPEVYPDPPYLAAVIDQEAVALLAVRTPPHHLILSEPGVAAGSIADAVGLLIDDVRGMTPDLPGVLGPKATVGPFVDKWSEVTGQPAALVVEERIYRLSKVISPRPTPGVMRRAAEQDRALLAAWIEAFRREALPDDESRADVDRKVDRWLHERDRTAWLWEVDGRVVSFAGSGSPTPNGIRIGPVYTPPEDRRRGYASALVAAASQALLDQGRTFCFLFTDLANPTSNQVYQAIGYEPVTDVDQYRLS